MSMPASEVLASRETDQVVAHEVLCEYPSNPSEIPHYSTSMDAALLVTNEIVEEGALGISLSQSGIGRFTCSIFRGLIETDINAPTSVSAVADTAPLAVCRAALEWARLAR